MLQFYKSWLSAEEATLLFDMAFALPLEQRYAVFAGKAVPMPRLIGWCNDLGFGYQYSGQVTPVMPWPSELLNIRDRLELFGGKQLPSVLINLYRGRDDSVSWHKDNEKWFKSDPFIVSLTVGAARDFKMRNRSTGESVVYTLGHGDLLIFTDEHVLDWEHSIPKAGQEVGPRVNFTFRTIKV